MSDNERSTPPTARGRGFVQFWTTLPGLLTAVATLLTALTAVGVFKATTNDQSAANAGAATTTTASTAPPPPGTSGRRVTQPQRRRTPSPRSEETGRAGDGNVPAAEVAVRADPFSGNVACPVTIRFLARISVTDLGGPGPVEVAYRWVRSDGASAPVETVTFLRPGSQDVETTWTRGGSAGDRVNGSQRLEITSPVSARSERAAFDLTCG